MYKRVVSLIYSLTAIIYLFTIITNYSSVADNLDWYDASSKAIYFVILCAVCIFLAIKEIQYSISSDVQQKNISLIIGIILIGFPFISHYIVEKLIGNVSSESTYIMLRVLQGFDGTYLILGILAVIGFISLILVNKE